MPGIIFWCVKARIRFGCLEGARLFPSQAFFGLVIRAFFDQMKKKQLHRIRKCLHVVPGLLATADSCTTYLFAANGSNCPRRLVGPMAKRRFSITDCTPPATAKRAAVVPARFKGIQAPLAAAIPARSTNSPALRKKTASMPVSERRAIPPSRTSRSPATSSTAAAQPTILELLRGSAIGIQPETVGDGARSLSVEKTNTEERLQAARSAELLSDMNIMEEHAVSLARSIDAGQVTLRGNPWVDPPSSAYDVDIENAHRHSTGACLLDSTEVLKLVLRPTVFVWAPDFMYPEFQIICPSCGKKIIERRWHRPRALHGTSRLSMYLTREYTCAKCKPPNNVGERRRKVFLADTPAYLATLPDIIRSQWRLWDTGRTLCDVDTVDLVRAMATKTSWSSIADVVNEMRQTAWARNIVLPYYQLCVHVGATAVEDDPTLPASHSVSANWIKNLFMSDASTRQTEIDAAFHADQGDEVLVLDWTRDAAKRCGSKWLLNVMDGRHRIHCSTLTSTCHPAGTKPQLSKLRDKGVKPKVIYVDDECCGAWPALLKDLWPDAAVRLDAMHAIRRLTSTTTCTQHPWHGRFCSALSKAIYTEDARAAGRVLTACREIGASMRQFRSATKKCVHRSITDPPRIVASVEKVLDDFAVAHDTAGLLLTGATREAWLRLKQHVLFGCLCDPPDVRLDVVGKNVVVGADRLPTARTARGSSALEGFHTHQKAWLGSLAQHAPDVGATLLADGATRWNRRIHNQSAIENQQPSVYAGGLLKEIAQTREIAREPRRSARDS